MARLSSASTKSGSRLSACREEGCGPLGVTLAQLCHPGEVVDHRIHLSLIEAAGDPEILQDRGVAFRSVRLLKFKPGQSERIDPTHHPLRRVLDGLENPILVDLTFVMRA